VLTLAPVALCQLLRWCVVFFMDTDFPHPRKSPLPVNCYLLQMLPVPEFAL
jgi:hypothetical protein